MAIIKLKDISKSYQEKIILKDVNVDINSFDHIGIVGNNGSGKTTLLKVIMGLEEPSYGKVELATNNIGYLKQATEYNYKDFQNIFMDKNRASDFLKIFRELNLDTNIDFQKERMQNLSGGEKTKLVISYILSLNQELLILDEPTNHVDIDSVEWLIKTLNNYNGTLLVVSHDRYFLNETVDKILEVDNGSVNSYSGNYDEYYQQKEQENKALQAKYEYQQKQDKKMQKEISQLKNWSEKGEREASSQGGSRSDAKVKGVKTNAQRKASKAAKMANNKRHRLEQARENYLAKPKEELEVKYAFQGFNNGNKCLIRLTDVFKQFNNKVLFKDVSFFLNSNEKIGLIGPNGCGKTTLIEIILGKQKADDGAIWQTPALKMAYMSQDVFDLNNEKTIMELANTYGNNQKTLFLTTLVNMGFNREQFLIKIKVLSLGERMRIKLAQIIVDDYNLLILDEPTNHLDLANKRQLEQALKHFPGAILIASHDKYLLREVTNKVLVFKKNKIIKYEEGYEEYENNFKRN